MGNNIVCKSQRKANKVPIRRKNKELKEPEDKESKDASTDKLIMVPPIEKKGQQDKQQSLEKDQPGQVSQCSNGCSIHPNEQIRAICITPECPYKIDSNIQQYSRVLCCECLIEHPCPIKLKITDFVGKLRSCLSRDALGVFMEIFDDNNQIKIDIEKNLKSLLQTVKTQIYGILEKSLSEIIQNYYLLNSELKGQKLEFQTIKDLERITSGKADATKKETIDLAVLFINDQKMTERLCEQIESSRQKISAFASDFQVKFQSLLSKYINSMKFIFEIFTTSLEYIIDDDLTKTQIKKQINGNILQAVPNAQSKRQKPDDSSAKIKKETKKEIQKEQKQQAETDDALRKCEIHGLDVIAICVTPICLQGKRRLCSDCLIEGAECQSRLKIAEFTTRSLRCLSKEIIEQILVPWEDKTIEQGMSKLLVDGFEILSQSFDEIIQKELQNLYVKYHLIEEAVPPQLVPHLSKSYFQEFTNMVKDGTIQQGFKSVEMGVNFLNDKNKIEQFLAAIVKTEQAVAKKASRLQLKTILTTNLFTERLNALVGLFKGSSDLQYIQGQNNQFSKDCLTLEETLYKIKSNDKSFGEWKQFDEFSPVNGLSITDLCFLNESLLAIASCDGYIVLWSLEKKKILSRFKHGTFVTSVISIVCGGRPILISRQFKLLLPTYQQSGFSSDFGCSLATWDLQSKRPAFQASYAHKDSIRRVKHLPVVSNLHHGMLAKFDQQSTNGQSSISQSQAGRSDSLQSVLSSLQKEPRQDDFILTCSDDGTVKQWKIDTNYHIVDETLLKNPGPCVLDFTLLNGFILVVTCIDKQVLLSIPSNSLQPFQMLMDDCPVYAVSAIDTPSPNQFSKGRSLNQMTQQKFATGNEKGAVKVYAWQNGKAIIQRTFSLHDDRINRILLLQTGFIASVSNDGTIALSLIFQNKVITRINGHKSAATSITYMRESGCLISTDQTGQVKLWK